MKADYLKLTDGREVRVEWNMNSMNEFITVTGKELVDLKDIKADVGTLRTIAWCSIREGEEVEGREFGLSEKELGRLMGMAEVIKFSEILTGQSNPGGQKKSKPPNKLLKIFTRGKD
jgi:hypothetical protein